MWTIIYLRWITRENLGEIEKKSFVFAKETKLYGQYFSSFLTQWTQRLRNSTLSIFIFPKVYSTSTCTYIVLHSCRRMFVQVRTPVHLSTATVFVQSIVHLIACLSMCALACASVCVHVSECVLSLMLGTEAYLPPGYIICILVTACLLSVRLTEACCVPLAAPWYSRSLY